MLRTSWFLAVTLLATSIGCGDTMPRLAVKSTSRVLTLASASMEMESDWEMAARAIPASLKTVEGFHVAFPAVRREVYAALLAQGYCQYATGFIEDEFERADMAKDSEAMDYHAQRATKAFFRCMNYGLELLDGGSTGEWHKIILSDVDAVKAKAAKAGAGSRTGMMWVAIGLAGAINFNKDDITLVAQLPKARILIERVVELDDKGADARLPHKILPHVALGMMHSAMSPAMGGQPELSRKHFERASELSGNRFLLARVMFARRYAVGKQDRELFRKTLAEVLQTDPGIWPEQRLANEIAHRRARRYLTREKEWF
jgi:hypothetical protein